MRKIACIIVMILLLTHLGYSQKEDQITTVMISSWSSPNLLSTLIENAKERGIILNIDHVEWDETKKKVKLLNFSVQFKKDNGELSKKNEHNLKFNKLTEGSIVVLQIGAGSPINPMNVLANNKEIFDHMQDIFTPENTDKKNTVFTTFSEPFNPRDKNHVDRVAAELRTHFRTSNELVYQIRKERDPGSIRYMYRYYYNTQRLDGSFGISELDMTCDASVKPDDDGVLSLFINSDIKLTPFAVLEN